MLAAPSATSPAWFIRNATLRASMPSSKPSLAKPEHEIAGEAGWRHRADHEHDRNRDKGQRHAQGRSAHRAERGNALACRGRCPVTQLSTLPRPMPRGATSNTIISKM